MPKKFRPQAGLYNPLMPLPIELAHRRYVQQAGWTQHLRRHLLARAGIANAKRVLEVGCGTGAVLSTIPLSPRGQLHGVDIDLPSLQLARREATIAKLIAGDAHRLPYSNGSFDIVLSHYLLLWLKHPAGVLAEMRRVTRRGGAVLALAEPDYGLRVDKPESLEELGRMQTEALRAQGANPDLGSRLQELFEVAGFKNVQSGQLEARSNDSSEDHQLEREIVRADLEGSISASELDKLLNQDALAWQQGSRVLHVPTFYAWAQVI